eukprot:3281050-Pyramimonas_sp.AAC.1
MVSLLVPFPRSHAKIDSTGVRFAKSYGEQMVDLKNCLEIAPGMGSKELNAAFDLIQLVESAASAVPDDENKKELLSHFAGMPNGVRLLR